MGYFPPADLLECFHSRRQVLEVAPLWIIDLIRVFICDLFVSRDDPLMS